MNRKNDFIQGGFLWRRFLIGMCMSAMSLLVYSTTFAGPAYLYISADKSVMSSKADKSATSANTNGCTFPDGTSTGGGMFHCYTPQQVTQAYGIDQLHNQGLEGQAQTIILVDSFGSPTIQQDLDTFSDAFNLPRTTLKYIYPDGPYTNTMITPDQQSWALETSLDVEWAHAIAPQAQLVNIVTNTDQTEGVAGFPDMFQGISMAIKQYPNSVISISTGTAEQNFSSTDIQQYVKGSWHDILRKAAQAHVTVFVSSGDLGTSAYVDTSDSLLSSHPVVAYPSVDPLVTAVGGTWLQIGWRWDPIGTSNDYWTGYLNCVLGTGTCTADYFYNYFNFIDTQNPNQVTEAVWKEDWGPDATTGGISQIFSLPLYQLTVGKNTLDILQNHRGVPDISMNASADGGVELFTSFTAQYLGLAGPVWGDVGGTSLSTPEVAALTALANQKASQVLHRQVAIGWLNPVLYSLPPGDFNNILPQAFGVNNQAVLNNNMLYYNPTLFSLLGVTQPDAVPGYQATNGYDLVTGRGSPKAVNYVNDVAEAIIRLNIR
jgi:subtilase family serine protease